MFGYFDTELGRVQISPTIIRGFILREIERSQSFTLQGMNPGDEVTRKIAERCIRVGFTEGTVEVTLVVSVRYGTRIIKEARELQGNVARMLQLKAGIYVQKVTINVESVFEKKVEEQPVIQDKEAATEENSSQEDADAVNQ